MRDGLDSAAEEGKLTDRYITGTDPDVVGCAEFMKLVALIERSVGSYGWKQLRIAAAKIPLAEALTTDVAFVIQHVITTQNSGSDVSMATRNYVEAQCREFWGPRHPGILSFAAISLTCDNIDVCNSFFGLYDAKLTDRGPADQIRKARFDVRRAHAATLMAQGRYQSADALLEELAEESATSTPSPGGIQVLVALADSKRKQNQLEEARRWLVAAKNASSMFSDGLSLFDIDIAFQYSQLEETIGNDEISVDRLRTALGIINEIGGHAPLRRLTIWSYLHYFLERQGRMLEARELEQQYPDICDFEHRAG